MSEAQEAKLKEELQAFQNTIQGLEVQLKVKEEELGKTTEYAFDLGVRLVNVTSKRMYWEFIVTLTNQRLDVAQAFIQDTEVKIKAVEDRTKVAEAEVISAASQAIESYKNTHDFKNEVGKATYDAYLKGFAKCKAKVFGAFSGIDLRDIVPEPDGKEEEEDVEVMIMKAETIETEGTKKIRIAEHTEELECTITESVKETAAVTVEQTRTKEATKEDSHATDTRAAKNSKGAKVAIRA